jgi:hypothetical protein
MKLANVIWQADRLSQGKTLGVIAMFGRKKNPNLLRTDFSFGAQHFVGSTSESGSSESRTKLIVIRIPKTIEI